MDKENAMATVESFAPNQLYSIPLADLEPDPGQPRKYFDPAALAELTASITRNSVMTPIFFRLDAGRKVIVAGERRCAAARSAGVERVPAIYVEAPNYTEISLIENMVRSDLNPVEEAEALDRLMKEHEYTQANLCEILSKSQPYISETLSLNGLPAEIRDECRQNPAIPKKTLLTIARKQSRAEMLKAYEKYKDSLSAAQKAAPDGTAAKVHGIFGDLNTATKKIAALDAKTFTKEERRNLLLSLQKMKEVVEKAIITVGE
jgi:ParB family transcriptional regulator, chromosome partitioning protein